MLLIWKEFIGPGLIMSSYSPLEWTLARLKLCLVFALAITIPLFFYQLYGFAAKGLYPNERRFFLKVIPASFLLFILGTAIGYFLVLPAMFKYILFYSGDMATAQLSVQNTLSAVTTILAGFGVVFQLPLLVIFAVKMGLVQYQTLKKQRILIYSAILAFSLSFPLTLLSLPRSLWRSCWQSSLSSACYWSGCFKNRAGIWCNRRYQKNSFKRISR
jgi:sec-independent protein translocase protein TatC